MKNIRLTGPTGHDVPWLKVFLNCAAFLILSFSGCANVGHDFPTDRVTEIHINQTTQEQIRSMFGPPWRIGLEDGVVTWTYGKYHYSLFSETTTKDLVVRFDKNGVVTSYTFNTSRHED
jgi:hypothetical protein